MKSSIKIERHGKLFFMQKKGEKGGFYLDKKDVKKILTRLERDWQEPTVKQLILSVLTKTSRPMNLDQIAKRAKMDDKQRHTASVVLTALFKEKLVRRNEDRKYVIVN